MSEIKDLTNGKLTAIIKYADENKLTEELFKVLSRFYRYIANGNDVELYEDWAHLSLAFAVKKEDIVTLAGGIIFHGSHDGGGNGLNPCFSGTY